jgi:hypothetical protein
MSGQGSGGNVIAAVCSFFIPGLGQLVQGRLLAAFLFFMVLSVAYTISGFTLGLFLIVAVPLHIWCILNAAMFKAG